MKIVPFGKKRDQKSLPISSTLEKLAQVQEPAAPEENAEPAIAETPTDNLNSNESPQMDASTQKLEEIEKAIDTILGGPSLDNLMLLLTAIGMSKISISVSEDKTKLSISGIINLSEEDTKIKKEK